KNVRIFRIDGDVAALGTAHGESVVFGNVAMIGPAWNRRGSAVLLRCVDTVGKLMVGDDVIKLRGGLVVPATPGAAGVDANADSLIRRLDHALRFRRIDP